MKYYTTYSSTHRYPFEMLARSTNDSVYGFGFNTQEKIPEINKNHYTALFWEYDSRLGRKWNLVPIVKEWESSYAAFANNPILFNDALSKNAEITINGNDITLSTTIYIYGRGASKEKAKEMQKNIMKKWYRKKLAALSIQDKNKGSNNWTKFNENLRLNAELLRLNHAELTASSGWYGSLYPDADLQVGGRPYEYIIRYKGGKTAGGYDYANGITVVETKTDGNELVPDQVKAYTKDISGNFKLLGGTDSKSTKPMVMILNSNIINYRIYIEVSVISNGNTHQESSSKINIDVYGIYIKPTMSLNHMPKP